MTVAVDTRLKSCCATRHHAAVLETARGGILRAGLGYRECDVVACINMRRSFGTRRYRHAGAAGQGQGNRGAGRQRHRGAERRRQAVPEDGRQLPRPAHMLRHLHPTHGLVREHPRQRPRVDAGTGINGDMITIYDNGAHIPLLWTAPDPGDDRGKAMHNVQNAMFAAP